MLTEYFIDEYHHTGHIVKVAVPKYILLQDGVVALMPSPLPCAQTLLFVTSNLEDGRTWH